MFKISPKYLDVTSQIEAINMKDADCLKKYDKKIVSEYDQEIPQSQSADNPMAPQGRATQPSQDTRRQIKQSNQLSLPHQADCNDRMDINHYSVYFIFLSFGIMGFIVEL